MLTVLDLLLRLSLNAEPVRLRNKVQAEGKEFRLPLNAEPVRLLFLQYPSVCLFRLSLNAEPVRLSLPPSSFVRYVPVALQC